MRQAIERLTQAVRPPVPARVVNVCRHSPPAMSVITLGLAATAPAAVRTLFSVDRDIPATKTLLVGDPRRHARLPQRAIAVIASELGRFCAATIGIAAGGAPVDAPGPVVELASAGWVRVRFDEWPTILTDCDLPAELLDWPAVAAVSAPAGDGAIRLWRDIIHPNSRLRVATNALAAVEPAIAIPATYIISGRVGGLWLAGHASDPVAAELLARGVERLREQAAGVEGASPWENAGVQRLTELAAGVTSASSLAVRAGLPDNAPGGASVVQRLGELLSCATDIIEIESGGTSGDARDEE